LDEEFDNGIEGLKKLHEKSVKKGNAVDAVLTSFAIRLKQPKVENVHLGPKQRL
jgi:hypothetical protein